MRLIHTVLFNQFQVYMLSGPDTVQQFLIHISLTVISLLCYQHVFCAVFFMTNAGFFCLSFLTLVFLEIQAYSLKKNEKICLILSGNYFLVTLYDFYLCSLLFTFDILHVYFSVIVFIIGGRWSILGSYFMCLFYLIQGTIRGLYYFIYIFYALLFHCNWGHIAA